MSIPHVRAPIKSHALKHMWELKEGNLSAAMIKMLYHQESQCEYIDRKKENSIFACA